MPLDPDHLAQLKHAYQVFELPITASSLKIKQAYRALTKRWHPDLYPAGSPEQAEATQMMKIVNDAYALIESAPLRYYDERRSETQEPHTREPYVAGTGRPLDLSRRRDTPPRFNAWEFWVRFVCGALLGACIGLSSALKGYYFYQNTRFEAWFAFVAFTLVVALGSAFSGDSFWHSALKRRWWWW